MTAADVPVFVTTRDRVTDLRKLVDWLERAGHQRITFLDNESTYEPLLEYFEQTPHTVIRLPENHGSQALWITDRAPRDEWFVLTDPDIVPTDECPLYAVLYLRELLDRYPRFSKAALGLYLDDVPASMPSLGWERELVSRRRRLERGVFDSLSDTTFALHRPGALFSYESIRTAEPFQARHTSWYVTEPGDEDRYYLEHAAGGELYSSWAAALSAA